MPDEVKENRRALLQLYSEHTVQYGIGTATLGFGIIGLLSNVLGIPRQFTYPLIALISVPMASIFISGLFYGRMTGYVVSIPLSYLELEGRDSMPALHLYYDAITHANSHPIISRKMRSFPMWRAVTVGSLLAGSVFFLTPIVTTLM